MLKIAQPELFKRYNRTASIRLQKLVSFFEDAWSTDIEAQALALKHEVGFGVFVPGATTNLYFLRVLTSIVSPRMRAVVCLDLLQSEDAEEYAAVFSADQEQEIRELLRYLASGQTQQAVQLLLRVQASGVDRPGHLALTEELREAYRHVNALEVRDMPPQSCLNVLNLLVRRLDRNPMQVDHVGFSANKNYATITFIVYGSKSPLRTNVTVQPEPTVLFSVSAWEDPFELSREAHQVMQMEVLPSDMSDLLLFLQYWSHGQEALAKNKCLHRPVDFTQQYGPTSRVGGMFDYFKSDHRQLLPQTLYHIAAIFYGLSNHQKKRAELKPCISEMGCRGLELRIRYPSRSLRIQVDDNRPDKHLVLRDPLVETDSGALNYVAQWNEKSESHIINLVKELEQENRNASTT